MNGLKKSQSEELGQASVKVVEKYFSSLRAGDLASLGELFDDNVIWHQPGNGDLSGTSHGKEQLFALFGQFMERSQGTFKIDSVSKLMVNGSLVVAQLHFSASRGDQEISMDGVDLMKIEDGKIKEVHLFSADQSAEDEFWNVDK